jgi:hypothetical protein
VVVVALVAVAEQAATKLQQVFLLARLLQLQSAVAEQVLHREPTKVLTALLQYFLPIAQQAAVVAGQELPTAVMAQVVDQAAVHQVRVAQQVGRAYLVKVL